LGLAIGYEAMLVHHAGRSPERRSKPRLVERIVAALQPQTMAMCASYLSRQAKTKTVTCPAFEPAAQLGIHQLSKDWPVT
jgi:hypothetical protein